MKSMSYFWRFIPIYLQSNYFKLAFFTLQVIYDLQQTDTLIFSCLKVNPPIVAFHRVLAS